MVDVTSEVRILGSEGPEGLTLRTSGLSARNLPELRVEGLPPYLGQGWARVLAALAQRLAASAEIPERVTLAPDMEICLTPAGDGDLAPVPPPGRDADAGHDLDRWRRDVVLRLFPEART
ncbi:hypothetical protein E1281_28210 [Actinomadura sp. KC345]|uniref:hypothetical protein n=1 Tax=Actinomadura sp. KC345 TaxID=2530371 RepID=UPI0010471D68|nr:hypothetical protein [Actinomadura sp. KC345]TDC46317.1 hypothetical protein E1281_28210 [Actinomadura sp. KC345]